MALPINDTAAFRQYTAAAGQTVFAVPFEFFEDVDLKVYKNSTLLTLTTHYTVTGADVENGGSITLTSGAAWPTSEGVATYGGADDTWSSGLTDSDIRGANFGVTLRATGPGGPSYTVYVDYIRVRVHGTA